MERIGCKKIFLGAILLLIVVNIFLLWTSRSDENDLLGLTNDLTEIIRQSPITLFEAVVHEQILCYKMENSIIDSITVVNEKNERQQISNILRDHYQLVIRYSKFGCSQCVDSVITIVNRHIDSAFVFHLVNGGSINELITYKRINNVKTRVYKTELINPELDQLNMPYLFLVNRDGRMKSLFVPHKEILPQINDYLKVIKEKYNLNKDRNILIIQNKELSLWSIIQLYNKKTQ